MIFIQYLTREPNQHKALKDTFKKKDWNERNKTVFIHRWNVQIPKNLQCRN